MALFSWRVGRIHRPYSYSLYSMIMKEGSSGILVSSSKFGLKSDTKMLPVLPYNGTRSIGFQSTQREDNWLLGLVGLVCEIILPLRLVFDFRFGYRDYAVHEGDTAIIFGTLEYSPNKGTVEVSKARYICASSKEDIVQHIRRVAKSLKWRSISSMLITGILVGAFACTGYWAYTRWRQRRQAALLADSGNGANVAHIDDGRCALCKTNPRTITYLPCGHLAVCTTCDEQHKCVVCPICQKQITGRNRIFYA